MAQQVRIGFIGTGNIARSHIPQLQQLPEAHVVALCDVDEARVREMAAPLEAAVYTDGAALIRQESLDALYICVPPDQHGDLEVQAAKKGLHLFVEKPVNLSIPDAVRAREAIRAAGVMSQVGYVMRYWAGSMQLKTFLADKPVGLAQVSRWNGLPANPWWRRYERSGGQLVEMTTHQVDLLRWVMGEVEAVSASYSRNRLLADVPDVTIPDSEAVLLRFTSGAAATITTSCVIGKTHLGGLDIAIRDARVSWKSDGIIVEPEGAYEVPPAPEAQNIDAAFVQAVATGDRSLLRSPYEDGLRSAAVTLAANLSADQGGRLVPIREMLPD